ncbi:MAG: hypothetical protein IVW54_22280 [Candidatus Binataceae bacterium]|nr:hypothetical protein [Candidatus Binataceae bacterium]
MPYIDGVHHDPAEAIAKGLCCECGRDLAQSSYQVEQMLHWPRGLDPTEASPEAIKRAALLKDYFDGLLTPAAAPAAPTKPVA